uniref:recombinase RecT n=1 Tax=Veillonella magna TaxID=464322 RepID=UPI00402A7551
MSNVTTTQETQPTMGQRFLAMVSKEMTAINGKGLALTDAQKRLGQNYFVNLDNVLSLAEEKRLAKSEKYREPIPYSWENIDLPSLARDVVAHCRVGLDPQQSNHLYLIPYANKHTGKYNIVFMKGYKGLELVAKKYALDPPQAVICELIYSTDKFKVIKRGMNSQCDNYEFEITNPFDRGTIVGGFYYYDYGPGNAKNKIVTMSIEDIEKRKPARASVEFWGGEKDVWENGRKTGKQHVEGWYPEMCLKTIKRAAYNALTIDASKIDDAYNLMKAAEDRMTDMEVEATISANANKEFIDVPAQAAADIPELESKPAPPTADTPDGPKPVYMDPVTGELIDEPAEGSVDLFADTRD